jgi:hygromycin-B 7''-O-kinase
MHLPTLEADDFDTRYRLEPGAWVPAVEELCTGHGLAPDAIVPFHDGSNLVASVGGTHVVKIFPAFHRHQWESERRVLPRFFGALPVPVPELVAEGERDDGYTYVIITLLRGESLETAWPRRTLEERASLLSQIGEAMRVAHALPVSNLADLPPPWEEFLPRHVSVGRARNTRFDAPRFI